MGISPTKGWQQTSGWMEILRMTGSANGHGKGFLVHRLTRLTPFQNFDIQLGRTLGACTTLGHCGTGMDRKAGYGSPLIIRLTPSNGRRNIKLENSNHTHFSLTLNPSHSDQLSKHHFKTKIWKSFISQWWEWAYARKNSKPQRAEEQGLQKPKP